MKVFFDNNLFLESCSAREIYDAVKSLPIIDYHCHLDVGKIAMGAGFEDVGQLWLAEDHYKCVFAEWMRSILQVTVIFTTNL